MPFSLIAIRTHIFTHCTFSTTMSSSSRTNANTSALGALIDSALWLILSDEEEEPVTRTRRRRDGRKKLLSPPSQTLSPNRTSVRYANDAEMRDEREVPISIFENKGNNKRNLRFGFEGRDEYHHTRSMMGGKRSNVDMAFETNSKDSLISSSEAREGKNRFIEIDKKRGRDRMVRPVSVALDASSSKRGTSRGRSRTSHESRNPSRGKSRTRNQTNNSSSKDTPRARYESTRTSSRGRSRASKEPANSKSVRSKSYSSRHAAQTPGQQRSQWNDYRSGENYIRSFRCSRTTHEPEFEDLCPRCRSKSAARTQHEFDISCEPPRYSSRVSPHHSSRSPRSEDFHSHRRKSKRNIDETTKNCLGMR